MSEFSSSSSTSAKSYGVFYKFKKYVVSKLSKSKGGRALIRNALGSEGHTLMKILLDLMRKYSDEAIVNELQKKFYNLVAKIHLLMKDQRISPEDIELMKAPNSVFAIYVYEEILKPINERNSGTAADLLNEASKIAIKVLLPHSNEKNMNKITDIITYFTSGGFLNFLMRDSSNDYACSIARESLSRLLHHGGSLYIDSSQSVRYTRIRLCNRLRALKPMLSTEASLEYMLRYGESSSLFCEWLQLLPPPSNKQLVNKLNCYIAYDKLQAITSPHVKVFRSEDFRRKYFMNPKSVFFINHPLLLLARHRPSNESGKIRLDGIEEKSSSIDSDLGKETNTNTLLTLEAVIPVVDAIAKELRMKYDEFKTSSPQMLKLRDEYELTQRMLESLMKDDDDVDVDDGNGSDDGH